MSFRFSRKSFQVADGNDAFLADVRGQAVDIVLHALKQRVGPHQTLAVLPEGVMVNYLIKRATPLQFYEMMPTEVGYYGEAKIVANLEKRPPDYVLLVHKDTSEYGFQYFGRDYGRLIYGWVEENYRPLSRVGAPPLQTDQFGILVMEHITQPSASERK